MILRLNHEIRQLEHALADAGRRQRLSNYSLAFGPLLAALLYAAWWVPQIPRIVLIAVTIPAIPLVISFCAAAYILKTNPGGRMPTTAGRGDLASASDLELELARKRDERKSLVASNNLPPQVRRVAYKEDAYGEIDQMRSESNGYRRVNNSLQGVLIIGSLAATGVAGLTAEVPILRWVTLGLTFLVGISSGFMGYFKYKERSFYLQQTADAIENEWEAVEILVGRYKRCDTEEEALAEFVEEVHRLKSEQKKRQQNLEQPPDAPKSE